MKFVKPASEFIASAKAGKLYGITSKKNKIRLTYIWPPMMSLRKTTEEKETVFTLEGKLHNNDQETIRLYRPRLHYTQDRYNAFSGHFNFLISFQITFLYD